ncbi:ninein-like protein [Heterodontus francisci]|uniref:ninein-like protein n=1 Tax=Heterodontus francisci TaxID=7792 RepID=UPI00355B20BE
MDEAEQNKYVLQLKDVFDSCDTTGTGYLDREELTELCQKLHQRTQIPLILQTLLGSNHHGRVNFEEFKEGFVAVLSTSIDLSFSEDESSYFKPATPEEVEPKYVRGTKQYGRRSMPEFLDSEVETTGDLEEPLLFKAAKDELFVQSTNRRHLRRSASLESVESLKSDEELEHHKEPLHETFEAQGQLSKWNADGFDSPSRSSTPFPEATENHVQAIWDELGVGKNGYLNKKELATVCDNIGLKDLKGEEVSDLFRKLDEDGDGKVSLNEFLLGLFHHGPVTSVPSTPHKQKYRRAVHQTFDENRSRTASLMSNTGGSQLFSGLDDGTGYASPEQIINMWQEDGIKNSQEILENLSELLGVISCSLILANDAVYHAINDSWRIEQHRRQTFGPPYLCWFFEGAIQLISTCPFFSHNCANLSFFRALLQNLSAVKDQGLNLVSLSRFPAADPEVGAIADRHDRDYAVGGHLSTGHAGGRQHLAELPEAICSHEQMMEQSIHAKRAAMSQVCEHMASFFKSLATFVESQIPQMRADLCTSTLAMSSGKAKEGQGVWSRLQVLILLRSAGRFKGQVQQLYKERDKVKADLDRAEKRNVQLAKEVDDRHAAMELLNETKIKHLDQGYKEKMAAVKLEMDREQELIVQQVNTQQAELQHKIDSLRSDEIHFQEKLNLAMKENSRLQKDLVETVEKLTESEKLVCRLQKDLDHMLKEKFGALDHPGMEIFGQEQRFSEIIMEYEQQCRELRDRNDELQSEMELLHSQMYHRKHRCVGNKKNNSVCIGADGSIIRCESVPDKVSPEGECANVSIKAEITLERLKRQHLQEVQDLKIQLETKVNYYEREIELMKRNFEKERKYVEQSFKIEISELEEQRMAREQEMERLQGVVNELRVQQQGVEARQEEAMTGLLRKHETAKANLQEELRKEQAENLKYKMEEFKKDGELTKMFEAWAKTKLALQMEEMEKRFDWEKTDRQQAFAKEKSELEQRFSKEKLQLEKELKLQHQKELQKVRKATQDEFNLRLSLLEVDHDAVIQKYQSENTELIQRHELKIEELIKQQNWERSRWKSQVQVICNEAKKEKLNLQEKMHEEQAEICSTFAIERKEMETKYKEQIHGLGCEIKSLKAQVKELRRVSDAGDLTHQDEKLIKDHPSLCRGTCTHPSTNEELSALMKKKEEILALQQQRDEMEIKLRQVTEESERKEQVLENEARKLQRLVTKLEAGTEAEKKYRYESEMLSEENASLKRKMAKFHQEFQDLEGKVNEQRKQVEQLKDERECRQREFEELQKQNKQYMTEVAQLNSKNLQLSNQNSQFSAKVNANQNSIQLLTTRLAELSQQKEEVVGVTRQLQETSSRLEKEHFQQQSVWEREKELMEKELQATKEKLLNLDSLAKETSALRAEKQSLDIQSKTLSQRLQETKEKMQNLELGLEQAHSELDHLKLEVRRKQQENLSLVQEMGSVTKLLQEAKDKLLETNTKLMLTESQHLHEVQKLKEQIGNGVPKTQLAQLQLKLAEEQQTVQHLQEQLNAQSQEANKLMCEQQEEYKRLLKRMEERMEEVEQKLKSVRMMLQEKVNQLKEQFAKNAKSDLMLKDLYVENAQLMKALQITEQRQKGAEKKNFLLDEKIAALNRLLRKIAPASIS